MSTEPTLRDRILAATTEPADSGHRNGADERGPVDGMDTPTNRLRALDAHLMTVQVLIADARRDIAKVLAGEPRPDDDEPTGCQHRKTIDITTMGMDEMRRQCLDCEAILDRDGHPVE